MAAFLSACGDDPAPLGPEVERPEPSGDQRAVMMGFTTLPAERSNEATIRAFATTAQYGDIVVIHRAPPWQDFLPGEDISSATEETTDLETRLLDQYDALQRVYAIDPTDPAVARERIADLPAGIPPEEGFNSPALRQAFIDYVTYVMGAYEPDYLVLGVEINMLYERSPEQFEAFVSLYEEAHAVAKAARPSTKVFPTFQLEDLEGTLSTSHSPHWEVLDYFAGMMDVLAISTFPYLSNEVVAAGDIRPTYFSQLTDHFEGEIMILETAYPSAPVDGEHVLGTEEDQLAYLQRVLGDAQDNGISAVVWTAALDPAWASGAAAGLRDIGLRQSDGSNKLGWPAWEDWARRPLPVPN
jgi:hypothetical protein